MKSRRSEETEVRLELLARQFRCYFLVVMILLIAEHKGAIGGDYGNRFAFGGKADRSEVTEEVKDSWRADGWDG